MLLPERTEPVEVSALEQRSRGYCVERSLVRQGCRTLRAARECSSARMRVVGVGVRKVVVIGEEDGKEENEIVDGN